MKKNRFPGRLSGKLAALALAAILLSSSAVAALSYVMQRNDIIQSSAERALSIADTIAVGIDPANFARVMATGVKTSGWYRDKRFVDAVALQNNLAYLYVLESGYTDTVRYYAEGYPPDRAATGEEEIDLYETEGVGIHADELFETIDTGLQLATPLYDSGEYGMMVSGFAPILSEGGEVIGVVGVDIAVDYVLQSSNAFGLLVIAIVLGFSVLFGLILTQTIKRIVGRPLNALAEASEHLAKGDTGLSLDIRSRDEIGSLAASFTTMIESTKHQVEILEALADGDLTVRIDIRGERDALGHALTRMVEQLNRMCADINQSSIQVAEGARQIAAGSDSLAKGSAEQASSIEELSSSVAAVAQKTRENASMARHAADLAASIRGGAEKGSEQMEQMLQAVRDISAASRAIQQVIKVINDITFQTNILALNASVEAAHAGAYGAGFAVVADEVRTLAQRSSEAAKNTSDLIANSMEKAALGARIADATARSFTDIVQNVLRSGEIVGEIAGSSEQQTFAIDQINQGIDQVARVVQNNTATAQQSAAASAEMREQSDALQEMVARFKLDQSARFSSPSGAPRPSGSSPSWVWQEDTVALAPDAGYGKY